MISSIDEIDDILGNGKADFVSMCRPFILEPDIVRKFNQGISREAKCIYCNYCTVAQLSRLLDAILVRYKYSMVAEVSGIEVLS